jgi:hypothetical protein
MHLKRDNGHVSNSRARDNLDQTGLGDGGEEERMTG